MFHSLLSYNKLLKCYLSFSSGVLLAGVLLGVDGSGDWGGTLSIPTFLLVSVCIFFSYALISSRLISTKHILFKYIILVWKRYRVQGFHGERQHYILLIFF